jgi:catechol 2,3-dioxygenase-like lactoylglutathione lyase family enzyme
MKPASVQRLLRISRTVSDLARAKAFYCDALDFCVIEEMDLGGAAWGALMGIPDTRGHCVRLRLGVQELELIEFDPAGRPYPAGSDAADLWFQHFAIAVSDIDAAYTQLSGYPFTPISQDGPQQLPAESGSVRAYKFRDADGHPVELIEFPTRRGNATWQRRDTLFLGIDHSAIDVAELDESIDFYTRALGFAVASRARNTGPAQQRLDRLREDVVDVVALQPAIDVSPHVELLHYCTAAGHPIPHHVAANDIAADRLVMHVDDLTRLADALHARNVAFVSPDIVELSSGEQAALIRDPTGHLVMLCA